VNTNAVVTVIGVSKEKDTIDGYEGHWVQIALNAENVEYFIIEDFSHYIGWVFSKYVANGDFHIPESGVLNVSQNIGIDDGENSKEPQKKYFQASTRSIEDSNFHYLSIPGIYVRYPETGEEEHIAYLWQNFGSTIESKGIVLTDDFKYVIKDLGTSPGMRGIKVFRIADGSEIFSGSYYRDFHLTEHIIEVVYSKSDVERGWQKIDDPVFDKEIRDYFASFESKVVFPDNVSETSNEQVIICSLNLDTLEQKILRGAYIGTQ
jgi:hypothetical protein